VDFWDITKLLVRRWMILVPMLVLSGVLAVLAMNRVEPDYIATAYVQLVPPIVGETKPGETTADQRNPWIGLGLQTIGNAAIVTVTDVSVADKLHAAGYSDSYTVTMGDRSPLITFEIVGKSPNQAKQTAEQLVDRFNNSVSSLQTSYGVRQADWITTRRLDLGTNVKESNSKVKRALVAVAGAGVLLTIATTVGVDAWLRRRQRRRDGVEPSVPARPAFAVAARGNGDHRSDTYLPMVSNPTNGGSVAGVGTAGGRALGPAGSNMEMTQPITLQAQAEPVEAERAAEPALAIPSDATIVLPRFRPGLRSGQGE
jgi:hypothetical protein